MERFEGSEPRGLTPFNGPSVAAERRTGVAGRSGHQEPAEAKSAASAVTDEMVQAYQMASAEWLCGCNCADRVRDSLDAVVPLIRAQVLREAVTAIEEAMGAQSWTLAFLNGLDHARDAVEKMLRQEVSRG